MESREGILSDLGARNLDNLCKVLAAVRLREDTYPNNFNDGNVITGNNDVKPAQPEPEVQIVEP